MNKYEIIGIVGEGAYGIVYKAKNKDSGEYGRSYIQLAALSAIFVKSSFESKHFYINILNKHLDSEAGFLSLQNQVSEPEKFKITDVLLIRYLCCIVAIKKFKESAEEDQIVKKTTKREVKMLSVLKDKSVVRMIEAFKRKGKLYLVFEFMDRNLLEVLEEKPDGLDRDSVKFFIYQLLKAVDYFHSQHVMHRDIKPENLLICSKTNELKVCDFGFARHLSNKNDWDNIHSSSNKSSQGGDDQNHGGNSPELTDYVATRWYRSPELLLVSENLPYGKEVDVWAVGCIMGELMDGQPLFPGDSEVDQLFVIQKVLGPLPDFLQEEFNRNTRYQGLKFPDISHPETLEARYAPVMNDVEIDLMKNMLDMDPYTRITARQAIEHDYFDDLRAKDPEYQGEKSESSVGGTLGNQESVGQLLQNNKRILSPELLNQRQKTGPQDNLNMSNKNSFSHASHHDGVQAARRSDNNYRKNDIKNQNTGAHVNISNSSQQNMMMKSNNSGGNFINLGAAGDPLHQQKKGPSQYENQQMIQSNMGQVQGYYHSSQGQANQKKGIKNVKNTGDQDYNYNINIEKMAIGQSGQVVQGNNPLLASVHTQGSLKGNELAASNAGRRMGGNKGSGNSHESHGGSGINIQRKDAIQNIKSGNGVVDTLGAPNHASNRVGSINSNPGSTASRGSKHNIHQQQNTNTMHMQTSQSPPSVRNKIQMHKIMKNSNQKNAVLNSKKPQNQYTMYQSNHLPMTSQQSRRKSQVSINNMVNHNQQIDPLQAMNFQGMNMAMGMQMGAMGAAGMPFMPHNGGYIPGMSDTGAAPDSSGGSMINIGGNNNAGPGMHPMQMYQSNFTGSSLAQYQAMNQGSIGGMAPNNRDGGINIAQQLSSQDKKRTNKHAGSKNNIAMRFNMQGSEFDGNHHMNMPMSSNAVLHHENWREDNSQNNGGKVGGAMTGPPGTHYKVGSKMKLGAATSTNFMKNNIHQQNANNQQYNMSMLRSVQQNMPNMPNQLVNNQTNPYNKNGQHGNLLSQSEYATLKYNGSVGRFSDNSQIEADTSKITEIDKLNWSKLVDDLGNYQDSRPTDTAGMASPALRGDASLPSCTYAVDVPQILFTSASSLTQMQLIHRIQQRTDAKLNKNQTTQNTHRILKQNQTSSKLSMAYSSKNVMNKNPSKFVGAGRNGRNIQPKSNLLNQPSKSKSISQISQTNRMNQSTQEYSSQFAAALAANMQHNRHLINLSPIQEYNYKIPAVASQSKIISGGSGAGGGQGGGIGAVYRGNAKKFVMNNSNQMQMAAHIDQRNMGGPNSISGSRQPRAATQGGHIFGGQMGRGNPNAYAHMGSKLNKIHANQQKFANSNMHDNSLSNGYLMGNASHGSPKYNGKSKYFSNQPPIMNMKFPTTSHGNRSSTNHNAHHNAGHLQQYSTNHNNMTNVLGNIQKHI